MTPEPKFDVVIYKVSTRKITNIVGRNLGNAGFHTVDKRLETIAGRLNDDYDCESVPTGSLKIGDKIQ